MAYADEVLADSPFLYYKFDEVSGTTVNDSSGNGRNGTYGTSVVLNQPGLIGSGSCVRFPADALATSTVNFGTTHALGTTYTVEAWMLLLNNKTYHAITALNSGDGVFTHNGSPSYFFTGADHDGKFGSAFGAPYVYPFHAVITSDGTLLKSYCNGKLVGIYQVTKSASFTFAGNDGVSTADLLNGYMDEFALYTTALSATRIAAHYAAASPLSYPMNQPPFPQYVYRGHPNAQGNSLIWAADDAGGSVSGTVKQEGVLKANRFVRAYWRDNGALVATTLTDVNGVFSFPGLDRNKKYFIVAFDDLNIAPDYNAQVFDLVVPA